MTKRVSQKVLVTGGGGFLGSAIVRRLVEKRDHVRSFSRGFYNELESLGVEQIRGGIEDKDARD
jgi:nucleoside-diphosphate-sugar epimerase